jgi:hypothetical protein
VDGLSLGETTFTLPSSERCSANTPERQFTPSFGCGGHSLGAHAPTQERPQFHSLHGFTDNSLDTPGGG